ncbi:MAG: NADH-quinone oxidoreductase subunit I [Bacteroidales bacterium]|nr:NADH-quinone oxidoreductase subunit I [Bacteroidales bacterium]MDY2916177.1 NADH-quinone oxidoreductase subunit I [Muribaculaceae bacterium]
MSSVKEYFKSLGNGFASLIKGLSVTGKEFVTPKITERYPEDRDTYKWPERFRACLELVYDKEGNHKCIACGTCERVCPNGTISLQTKMVDTLTGKKRKLVKYSYDLGSCTFCQLCVTNCPTQALDFSNNFEQAVFTRSKLVKQLNYLPEKEEPAPTPEQLAAAAAERERKIAEAKAKAAAMAAAKAKAAAAGEPAPMTPAEKAKAAAMADPELARKIAEAKAKAAAIKAAREKGEANS